LDFISAFTKTIVANLFILTVLLHMFKFFIYDEFYIYLIIVIHLSLLLDCLNIINPMLLTSYSKSSFFSICSVSSPP